MKRIAIAPGDPAGIGYEITAKALYQHELQNQLAEYNTIPIVYANLPLFYKAIAQFTPGLMVTKIDYPVQAEEPGNIYIIDSGKPIAHFEPGVMSGDCAFCAHQALEEICRDVKKHGVDGICTGPIHKGAMRMAGVPEIGHTEMLAKALDASSPVTMFITRNLRIFFYSRHLSLRQAIDALDCGRVVEFGQTMHKHMMQLGFKKPHLAMAALNPHASDGGQFGTEEAEILIPAAEILRNIGVDISDPIGADSVFAQAAEGRFDAVMSLYHDQGHIAAKTYDFERTISATLGLPCLRTSVDHGTAFDIAWQNKAQSISMTTAIETLIRYI